MPRLDTAGIVYMYITTTSLETEVSHWLTYPIDSLSQRMAQKSWPETIWLSHTKWFTVRVYGKNYIMNFDDVEPSSLRGDSNATAV